MRAIRRFRRTPNRSRSLFGLLPVLAVMAASVAGAGSASDNPADVLPSHIRRITWFGQRADWSHDGEKILFVEKTYGDVYEVVLETGDIRPLTHHYPHEGYTRALYLANGDVLLSGARTFEVDDPPLEGRLNAELWILDKSGSAPPVALETKCFEGPAVSRTRLRIACTSIQKMAPEQQAPFEFWMADIVYDSGKPALRNRKVVLRSNQEALGGPLAIETQSFRPPDETELIFTAVYGDPNTEIFNARTDWKRGAVLGLDLQSGRITPYSKKPLRFDEAEGIFPDGRYTLVESDRHNEGKGNNHIDIWKLRLDRSEKYERLTFFNEFPEFKASNPVVSPDGRFMVFQIAKVSDIGGIGRGLFLFSFDAFERGELSPER